MLFSKVAAPPPTAPQTAIWHFGWHVTDIRKTLATYKAARTSSSCRSTPPRKAAACCISSDTWPGTGGVLGLTKAQIAEARAKGVKPAGGGGFAYLQGPDGAIVEYQGDRPVERMNHVHMYQEHPYCAQLWYQKHLNAPVFAGPRARDAD